MRQAFAKMRSQFNSQSPFLFSNNLTAWHGGDNLVLAVAAQNNNTIVIVNSVGPLILEPWIDHPNVSAVRIPSATLPVCIIFNLNIGDMGRYARTGSWQRVNRYSVRRLEPVWEIAVYHREESFGLSCSIDHWRRPQPR